MKNAPIRAAVATALLCALLPAAAAAGPYTKRMGDPQNTMNVGDDPGLRVENATRLRRVATIPTRSGVNATPLVVDDLLFIGDWGGYFYVVDLATGARLIDVNTGANTVEGSLGSYQGVQSSPLLATVTVPGASGAREERRVYFAASTGPENFWCLDVDRILADRGALRGDPGKGYFCSGAEWPISVFSPGGAKVTIHGSPLFGRDQPVEVAGKTVVRDVLYVPSPGLDCDDGVLWAIDAYSGAKLWMWDPVELGNSQGGVIWTVPAMSRDGKTVFVTTGDCVQKPQVGERAESIVALDAATGDLRWWHQRRLIDTADLDIGNSPTVVDVAGANGCHMVVSTDKDGCVYGFRQAEDIPAVGEPGFDPLRVTQQRLRWRTCLVPGSLNGGFNASGAAAHGRHVIARSSSIANAPRDNATLFALDACDGSLAWTSADVGKRRAELAVASGMAFVPSGNQLQVLRAAPPWGLLATVALGGTITEGGGGPAIAGGAIYVPLSGGGVAVVAAGADQVSAPVAGPAVSFNGPYPLPISPDVPEPHVNPDDPYPPLPED
jgi:outer membrane protein assembly factor BamB